MKDMEIGNEKTIIDDDYVTVNTYKKKEKYIKEPEIYS